MFTFKCAAPTVMSGRARCISLPNLGLKQNVIGLSAKSYATELPKSKLLQSGTTSKRQEDI